MREERKSYYFKTRSISHQQEFIDNFNEDMQTEVTEKQLLYKFRGLQKKIDNIISVNNVLKQGGVANMHVKIYKFLLCPCFWSVLCALSSVTFLEKIKKYYFTFGHKGLALLTSRFFFGG